METMELIVDNFAGGGGASTGIEAALGRPVDIAINHDPDAIAMHQVNHPHTKHFCESVWDINPVEACGLFRAQGFRDSYIIDRDINGKPLTKTTQVAKCGNSVSPPHAEALVRANYTGKASYTAKSVNHRTSRINEHLSSVRI